MTTSRAPGQDGGSAGAGMAGFSPVARAWFGEAFDAPTPAQVGAWQAIAGGNHTLVVAPTGSGKTLAAFLWALDRLSSAPRPEDRTRRCRVLYISPMKALAVDVERNLRAPLAGLRRTADRLGQPAPDITVGVRSGDTSADARRRLVSRPPDVLITTPESLFLMLTSRARESLRGVDTVIVDEVHAVAGTKRGAHLALSLERLDELLEQPAQRIGLSATVRPVDEVARFLGGARPVAVVAPPSRKRWQLEVVVPVEDMSDPAASTSGDGGPDHDPSDTPNTGGPRERASIWPHVEERIVDLVEQHRSTIVFANSRRLAERLTARLNEIAAERRGEGAPEDPPPPAQVMAQAARRWACRRCSRGPITARSARSNGRSSRISSSPDRCRASSPPRVSSSGSTWAPSTSWSRSNRPRRWPVGSSGSAGRGTRSGEVSRGVLFPKHRGDLVQTAVTVERMRSGQIEALRVPTNTLDVLAQQVVACVALDSWRTDDLFAVVRRSAPFATLPRSAFEATLDLLSGRYPSDEFGELRPRIVWDRVSDTLTGRPGAQRLAVTSGGTIPDRGLFGVFLVGSDTRARPSRVGELDEEMVYESRVGDVFALGTSSWRIEEITHDRVLVSPAPGQPGRLPFWKGDTLGRPAELGAAVGAFVREIAKLPEAQARERAASAGLDAFAAGNLVAYVAEQLADTGAVPHDRQLVVERCRDELGDWRLIIHSPYGAAVHGPWALAIGRRLQERFGVDAQAMAADDGIVLRIPDTDAPPPGADVCLFDPDELDELVTSAVGGSALFASRFRECAARALLLPRRDPGKRSALWQQRQKSAALLEVASKGTACSLISLGRPGTRVPAGRLRPAGVAAADARHRVPPGARRRGRDLDPERVRPIPAVRLCRRVHLRRRLAARRARRAAALALDPSLLSELLGRTELLVDLLDAVDVIEETERELQWLAPERRAL